MASEVQNRESRLGTIVGYNGTVSELVEKGSCGQLKDGCRKFSQANSCTSECAHNYLAGIEDAVIINHAPVGCSADSILYNIQYRGEQIVEKQTPYNIGFFSTNMNREDTIFGASEKLMNTIREVYQKYKPKAIFVTTSCVSGIIGEDVQAILSDLQDEIPATLVPVFCEGVKSKTWSTGWDAAMHAILEYIVKPPVRKTNKVNLINFHVFSRSRIKEALEELGFEAVFQVPTGRVEKLESMSEAAATIGVCETLTTYMGTALEERYGVPFVKCMNPHGITGWEHCLRTLGEKTGKEKEVEAYLAKQKEMYEPELLKIREKLKGTRAVLGFGAGFAHDYARVMSEIGIETVWIASWHYDPHLDDGDIPEETKRLVNNFPDLPNSVNDMQNFELINLLRKVKPDLYISRHRGTGAFIAKLGITAVIEADADSNFGYRGTVELGKELIDILTNRSWEKNISAHLKLPYTKWWLEQKDSFQFMNKERRSRNE